MARHLGRHLPGEPTVVVKNMPGAGSAKAAQYITTIAPKDGTSIAGIMPGAIMGPLVDDRTAPLFDPTKVRYVGTANSGTRVCVTLKSGKIQTFDGRAEDQGKVRRQFAERLRPSNTAICTSTPPARCGTSCRAIAARAEMALAMERGEIDGVCGWDWSSFRSQKPDWLRDNKANMLMQVSLDPHPLLTKMGVPTCSISSRTRTTARWSS